MATYGTIITRRGEALLANYLLLGRKLNITEIAVGDGDGGSYQPTPEMTELRREVWRGKVNSVEVSELSPNVIIIRALIPQDVGGFTIREAGVFDAYGNMIGIMNTPTTEKIAMADGASTEQHIEVYLAVSSTEAVNLEIDPSAIMASRKDLEVHNVHPEAHPDIRAGLADTIPSEELANVDHDLGRYPSCTLLWYEFGFGAGGYNEGAFGGSPPVTIPVAATHTSKDSLVLSAPGRYAGELRVDAIGAGKYVMNYKDEARDDSLLLILQ